jgi:hypothetical protein
MSALCTRDELRRRFKAYERQRAIVSAIGFTPFLVIYVLVHTRYLRSWLPPSHEAELVVLIALPAAWFAMVMLVHSWLAPGLLGLRCAQCGHRLLGRSYADALETGQCNGCRAPVISDPTSAGTQGPSGT